MQYNKPEDADVQQRNTQNLTHNDMGQQDEREAFISQTVASSVGNYMLTTGKQRAQQALNIYSHIDYLRPYFDVEPKDVLNRLKYSLVPTHFNTLKTELYGPLMIIFTLCAILIYQMKMANHSIEDGTLIGSAFFVCFSYWIGSSVFFSSFSYVFNSTITLFNYLDIIGYSLFSHCIVLLLGTFIHTSYDHFIFYVLWLALGGAAGLKLAFIVYQNTPHPQYRITVAVTVAAVHMLFLLYTHFAYHELAEEVSHALFDKGLENQPVKLLETVTGTSGVLGVKDH